MNEKVNVQCFYQNIMFNNSTGYIYYMFDIKKKSLYQIFIHVHCKSIMIAIKLKVCSEIVYMYIFLCAFYHDIL